IAQLRSAASVTLLFCIPPRPPASTLFPYTTLFRSVALRSGLDAFFPGLDLHNAPLGIFGKAVPRPEERVVEEGERVEIYRPLIADPKEVRKQRAARAAQAKAEQGEG